ncbi:unnamed protein product [Psylliodes chrysocephalus]|uniref:Peroxidase n=1 Tax=Psylliodes chrysocephalus TaxID=3402493 RepID=A0A9P0G559_9CUCU|nr:unnamed protein product [Psylliodes chrysocephala]
MVLLLPVILITLPYVYSIIEECGLEVNYCKNEKFRSISGGCNNLKHPNWGTIHSTYDRLILPNYGPSNSIRSAVSGNPLPNARLLSQNIFTDKSVPDKEHTLVLMQYGQYVAHDMSFTFFADNPGKCCTPSLQLLENSPPECVSVEIPPNDPDYQIHNITCISVLRTQTNQNLNCSKHLKYGEQLNAANNYLDLSVIYGSTDEESNSLRTFKGGTLAMDFRDGYSWLTASQNRFECGFNLPTTRCYRAGDLRVDQNPQLTTLHILWAREHNRICYILQKLNPHWDDERLFQEARRIAIAQHQYITFYELLQLYFGQLLIRDSHIIFDTDGYVDDYDDEMRPHVFNEHAQGAFRHFHGMVEGHLNLVSESGCPYRTVNIRDTINSPHFIEECDNFDGLCRGMTTQPPRSSDMFMVPEMSKFIFLTVAPVGSDLKAIDIQRAREHGLGTYNDMREFCGLRRARHFHHFLDVIDEDRVELLRTFYEHPDDVDLPVGGSMERKVDGALAGPTTLCIMEKQFKRTRKSDRFWFENEKCGLSYEQLREIRKSSISKFICDNGNNITTMQIHGFLQLSYKNPRVSCELLAGPNLELWREGYRKRYVYNN